MEPTGFYKEPGQLEIPTPYYGIRWNEEFAYMSKRSLGLQILVHVAGGWAWINIMRSWIIN